jgi:hypothetical protein
VAFSVACHKIFYAASSVFWVSNAWGACRLEGFPVTPAMINDFLQTPEIILSGDAKGQRGVQELRGSVTKYTVAVPAAIQAIKSILPNTTHQQRAAIGEGLYAAVAYCRAIDPATATRIETAIKFLGNDDVRFAYQVAAGLSGPPIGVSKPKIVSGFASPKPSGRTTGLIGEPSPANPGSLKLSDPFGSPDDWR